MQSGQVLMTDSLPLTLLNYLSAKQVQDKKVKKISSLSMEISKGVENSTTTSASTTMTVSARPKIAYAWHYGRPASSLAGESSRAWKDSLSFAPRVTT